MSEAVDLRILLEIHETRKDIQISPGKVSLPILVHKFHTLLVFYVAVFFVVIEPLSLRSRINHTSLQQVGLQTNSFIGTL